MCAPENNTCSLQRTGNIVNSEPPRRNASCTSTQDARTHISKRASSSCSAQTSTLLASGRVQARCERDTTPRLKSPEVSRRDSNIDARSTRTDVGQRITSSRRRIKSSRRTQPSAYYLASGYGHAGEQVLAPVPSQLRTPIVRNGGQTSVCEWKWKNPVHTLSLTNWKLCANGEITGMDGYVRRTFRPALLLNTHPAHGDLISSVTRENYRLMRDPCEGLRRLFGTTRRNDQPSRESKWNLFCQGQLQWLSEANFLTKKQRK